jgi:hypothetical protein
LLGSSLRRFELRTCGSVGVGLGGEVGTLLELRQR